jgi:hypothetical protein
MQKRADLATHWQSSVLTLHDFLDHGWRSGSPASSVQLMKDLPSCMSSPSARGLHGIIRCGIFEKFAHATLRPLKRLGADNPAALQQPRRNCNCQYIQGFRFPKVRHATRRAKAARCNAAFALPGCAMDDPAATKACYKKAQAVEIRVPLD